MAVSQALYFILSAIAFCISPYASFYAELSCLVTCQVGPRSQFVYVDSAVSNAAEIKYGVPQGSVLGPLLFIIYVKDIVSSSSFFKFILFADDTNLLASHTNL